jgi:hypothetical protein
MVSDMNTQKTLVIPALLALLAVPLASATVAEQPQAASDTGTFVDGTVNGAFGGGGGGSSEPSGGGGESGGSCDPQGDDQGDNDCQGEDGQ